MINVGEDVEKRESLYTWMAITKKKRKKIMNIGEGVKNFGYIATGNEK